MTGYPRLSEHELRTTLCRIAAGHQPDRAAMLHRIAQHRLGAPVAERRPAGQAQRLAGSALAVATILGVGGVARWALADGPDPAVGPIAPPATTRLSPPASPTAAAPPATTRLSPPASPTAAAPPAGTPATSPAPSAVRVTRSP